MRCHQRKTATKAKRTLDGNTSFDGKKKGLIFSYANGRPKRRVFLLMGNWLLSTTDNIERRSALYDGYEAYDASEKDEAAETCYIRSIVWVPSSVSLVVSSLSLCLVFVYFVCYFV